MQALDFSRPSKLNEPELEHAVLFFSDQVHLSISIMQSSQQWPRAELHAGAAAAAPRKSARVAAMDAVSSGAGCGARPQSQGAHGPSQTPTEPFAEHSEDTWEAPLPPTQVDDPAGASQEPPGRSSGAAGAGALSRAAAAGASGRAEGVAGEDADGCAEQAAAAAEALAALLVQKVWGCVAAISISFSISILLRRQERGEMSKDPDAKLDSCPTAACMSSLACCRHVRG